MLWSFCPIDVDGECRPGVAARCGHFAPWMLMGSSQHALDILRLIVDLGSQHAAVILPHGRWLGDPPEVRRCGHFGLYILIIDFGSQRAAGARGSGGQL